MRTKQTEFQLLWKRIRVEWMKEVRKKLHSRTGMGNTMAKLLDIDASAVSSAKNGHNNIKIGPRDYVAISKRFSIPVDELIFVQLGKKIRSENL